MTRKERYRAVVDFFTREHPIAETELNYTNSYELLVAVILSAQCTDKRVNMVTPGLFEAFPTPQALAHASFDQLHPHIRSISYPNNKTRHLLNMAQMLVDDFKGKVPETLEELQRLPGVGRKTANVILSVIYNQPAMAVDTHVFRVSKRLGLVNQNASTPLAVEKQLLRHLDREVIPQAHHWLILHGRYICKARNPVCKDCGLTHACRYYQRAVTQNVV